MDIFFTDADEAPVPPEEVRIRKLTAKPWPDGRRVKLYLEVTPFQKRPSGEAVIRDASGQSVAAANIIETIDPKMEVNLHLRSPETGGDYSVAVVLFYLQEIEEETEGEETLMRPERVVVDEAQTSFTIEN